jgi:hypothetical protein
MAIASAAQQTGGTADAVAGLLLQPTARGTWLGWAPRFAEDGTTTALDVARQFLSECSNRGVTFAYTAMAYPKQFEVGGQVLDGFSVEAWADDPTRVALFVGRRVTDDGGDDDVELWAVSAEARRWLGVGSALARRWLGAA